MATPTASWPPVEGADASAPTPGSFVTVTQTGDSLTLAFSGAWIIHHARALVEALEAIRPTGYGVRAITLRCSGLTALDTSGAWIIHRQVLAWQAAGLEVDMQGFKEDHFRFLRKVEQVDDTETCRGPETGLIPALRALGRGTFIGLCEIADAVGYFGRLAAVFGHCLRQPARFRVPSIVRHMLESGANAIPIVALMAFLIAIVLAYQGATQLQQFGAEIYTIDLTALAILREMGVMLTAILIAGRSGSAFAAEIGVMRINEEVAALRTMGLDPFEVLVLPRVIALVLMLPLLTALANLTGLAGGALMAVTLLDVPMGLYLDQAHSALDTGALAAGLIKAPVFAFLIATVATYRGMQASGSADRVGELTTIAVVQSIFLVMLADAIFSVLFAELGI